MHKLTLKLAETEEVLRNLNEQKKSQQEYIKELTEQEKITAKKLEDCYRKVEVAIDNALEEFKKIHGDEIFNLRLPEWEKWRQQHTPEEFLDNVWHDFYETYNVKVESIKKSLFESVEQEKSTRSQLILVQSQLKDAEAQVEESQSALDNLKLSLLARDQEIAATRGERDELIKDKQAILDDYNEARSAWQLRSEQLNYLHKIHAEKKAQSNEDLEGHRALVHRLSETVKEKEAIIEKVEGQVEAGKSEVAALQGRIISLTEKLTYERHRIRELTEEVRKVRDSTPSSLNRSKANVIREGGGNSFAELLKIGPLRGNPPEESMNDSIARKDSSRLISRSTGDSRSQFMNETVIKESVHEPRLSSTRDVVGKNVETIDIDDSDDEPNYTYVKMSRKNNLTYDNGNDYEWTDLRRNNTHAYPRRKTALLEETKKIVPEFSAGYGSNNASELDKYLRSCLVVLEGSHEAEYKDLVECFKLRLAGEAFKVIDDSPCTSFKEMKAILSKKYISKLTYQGCLMDIRTCKQQPGETTSAYVDRANSLLGTAYKVIDEEMVGFLEKDFMKGSAERDMTISIRNGLRNKKACKHLFMTMKEEASLGELVEEIEKFERGCSFFEDGSKQDEQINVLRDPAEELKNAKNEIMKELLLSMNKSKEYEREIYRGQWGKDSAGERGHIQRDPAEELKNAKDEIVKEVMLTLKGGGGCDYGFFRSMRGEDLTGEMGRYDRLEQINMLREGKDEPKDIKKEVMEEVMQLLTKNRIDEGPTNHYQRSDRRNDGYDKSYYDERNNGGRFNYESASYFKGDQQKNSQSDGRNFNKGYSQKGPESRYNKGTEIPYEYRDSQDRQKSNGGPFECFLCREQGHFAKDCKSKTKDYKGRCGFCNQYHDYRICLEKYYMDRVNKIREDRSRKEN